MKPAERAASPPQRAAEVSLFVVLVIGLGGGLVTLDSTLVNAIFPAVLASFDRDVSEMSWVVNAGNLSLAASLLIGGRLADAYGRRRMWEIGLISYGGFSLFCGIAPEFFSLVAARILLGISGALLMVCSLALIGDVVPAEKEAAAIGLYGALSGLASVVGPLAGSIITQSLGWRSAFLVNIPICIAGLVLAWRMVPRDLPVRGGEVNWLGCSIAGATIAAMMFALWSGPKAGWSSLQTLASLFGSAIGMTFVLRSEATAEEPMFPRALRQVNFVLPLLGILGLGFSLGVSLFSLPLFLTEVQGHDFVGSGSVLAPAAVTTIVFALVSGKLAARFGYSLPGGIGLAFSTSLLFLLATLTVDSTMTQAYLFSVFGGVGLGLGIPAMAGWSIHQAGEAYTGVGSSWYQTVRQLGIALGVVTFAVILSGRISDDPTAARGWVARELEPALNPAERAKALEEFERLRACSSPACRAEALHRLDGEPELVTTLVAGLRRDLALGFRQTFLWCGGICSVILLVFMSLAGRARRQS